MPGPINYNALSQGLLGNFLLQPVGDVIDMRGKFKGINPMNTTEGARPYYGGTAQTKIAAPWAKANAAGVKPPSIGRPAAGEGLAPKSGALGNSAVVNAARSMGIDPQKALSVYTQGGGLTLNGRPVNTEQLKFYLALLRQRGQL